MAISRARELTRQFYEWELRGRGWHKADYICDLEPPFVPFFGHFIEGGEIIDDGKVPRWFDRLFEIFSSPPVAIPQKEEEMPAAFPYTDTSPLRISAVILPKQFRSSGERMEQLLVMLSYRKSAISFEIIGERERIVLQFACREPDAVFLHTQLCAFFPECAVLEAEEDALMSAFERELPLYTVDFGLEEEFMRPLAMRSNADPDPLTALFGILSRLGPDECVIVQMLFSGTHNAWAESIMTAVCDESKKQSFFVDAPEMPQLAREKVAQPLYGVTIRALTLADTLAEAGVLLRHVATALTHASTGTSNALIPLSDERYAVQERMSDLALRTTRRVGMLLNSRELATLVHFPAASLSKKLLGRSNATKAAPSHLTDHDYVLGLNAHQGVETVVGIPMEQRVRHLHVIGATGTGKSTLLHALIQQDIHYGEGCCVIDPHGDLIDSIIAAIPEHRIKDVVLIDPSDSAYPIALNVLSAHSDLEKELLASDLVALFRRFSTSWGDQMNSVFANAISAFVYNTKAGHLGNLRKFLIEQTFRNQMLDTCTDPDIVYYWHKEYPILKSSSIGSILTRLDSFLRPKAIRNMVCQTHSLNFQELMDGKKIVLVKLSQGLFGEENGHLLGAFIVSKLQQTAMARQAQAAHDRVPFYCYIDEFQHYVTPSMAIILSGARKYSLGLVLAHQDMLQVSKIDNDIAQSVLSNAGTRICFRLGDADAKRMQEGLSAFTADDLQSLPTGEAIVRVNTRDQDFNIAVIPFALPDTVSYMERIIEHSRATYCVAVLPPMPLEPPTVDPPAPKTPVHTQQAPTPGALTNAPTQKEIREHRYLQTLVKKMAEEHGYKAQLEVPTPDGKGQVDVLLEKDGQCLAVEISVTTTAEWELHNIRKCLAAKYGQVVVCTNSPAKLHRIQALIRDRLSKDEQLSVAVISQEDIQSLFVKSPQKEATTILKGYRVKVKYGEGAHDAGKEDVIRRIMRSGK